ncbi:MAG: permease-like cell division protein FtsX [Paludibacteraceae bacterium]|nr:permease-like cell division protein FtsX [Paludibacteraceae bacterium]
MAAKRKFFNMHLTTTISISLVLFLVGLECVLLLSAHSLLHRVKEDVAMTVIMPQDADSTAFSRMDMLLSVVPYCSSYRFISREEALNEHIRYLGEDPTEFLGYNPLSDSYEIHLKDGYVHPDSMKIIADNLKQLPYVSQVMYQKDLLEILNHNFNDLSLLLLSIALILLLISEALIINTIRLQIYSKRFIIRTMDLVGATSWMIKRPFVSRNVLMGVVASLISLVVLAGAVYYVQIRMGIVLFPWTWQNLCLIAGVVVLFSVVLTLFTSLIVCGRYIRMKEDTIYSI